MSYEIIINTLKDNGFKESKTETLSNKQFKEVSRGIELNEETSCFGGLRYEENFEFNLLVDKNKYKHDDITKLVEDLYTNLIGFVDISLDIDNEENEYLIILNILIK